MHGTEPAAADLFGPTAPKVKGGTDLVGDAYDASSDDPAINTPVPDPNPLDCNGPWLARGRQRRRLRRDRAGDDVQRPLRSEHAFEFRVLDRAGRRPEGRPLCGEGVRL